MYSATFYSLQAVNEFLIPILFLARYGFRNILEVRSVSKCTACTQIMDVHFSNLMDAGLYNNFVGQEMYLQPTSEKSELAADLCGGTIENSFCYLKYTLPVRPYEKPNSYLDYCRL